LRGATVLPADAKEDEADEGGEQHDESQLLRACRHQRSGSSL
jgi:hypothetical protein